MDSLFLGIVTLVLLQGVIDRRDHFVTRMIGAVFFLSAATLFVWSLG